MRAGDDLRTHQRATRAERLDDNVFAGNLQRAVGRGSDVDDVLSRRRRTRLGLGDGTARGITVNADRADEHVPPHTLAQHLRARSHLLRRVAVNVDADVPATTLKRVQACTALVPVTAQAFDLRWKFIRRSASVQRADRMLNSCQCFNDVATHELRAAENEDFHGRLGG